jgi:hypothetical protein
VAVSLIAQLGRADEAVSAAERAMADADSQLEHVREVVCAGALDEADLDGSQRAAPRDAQDASYRAAPGAGLTCLISPYLPRYRRSGRKTGLSGSGGMVGGEFMLAYQAPEAWWAGSLWRIATAWAQPSLPTRGWPGTGWRTR